jgi:ABC-type methionine transport system ATPase subunit
VDAVIAIEGLEKTYVTGALSVTALIDVSFTVERGSFIAVMGPSGSGKSTLMNILGCLDRPTHGRVAIDGIDIATLDADGFAALRRRAVGFVFQSFNLLPRLTALDNVAMPTVYARLGRAERRRRAAALLAEVGLADRAQHKPPELSGGQKQRICIARALAAEPDLIICDEVTSALDQVVAEGILKLLLRLQKRLGVSYLYITHDLATVKAIADSIVVMHQGRIVQQGPKGEVLRPPHHPYTELLLSSVPEMVPGWLDGVLAKRAAAGRQTA